MKMDELGIDYEIIDYQHPHNLKYYFGAASSFANKVTVYSKLRSFRRKLGKRMHHEYLANAEKRDRKFDEFTNKYFVKVSKPIRNYEELQEYSHKFSDIIVGSDQMWLPSGLGTKFYNLLFAPDECNKIAYASSFGVSTIPKNQIDKTRIYLDRIEHISVREKSGQKIVKELTDRDVPIILDPTMIVTRAQWDNSIQDKRIIPDDYIFCYFLGNNQSHRIEANKLSKKTGLKIVSLKHMDEYIPSDEAFGDLAPYDVGPEEFVNLIRHAKYVCTDSFHGSVFSIIYHKQFITFNRFAEGQNSRNSRLDTLFQNIGLSRRYDKDIIAEMIEPIDYDEVDRKLEKLRKVSHDYIVDALSISCEAAKKQNINTSSVKHVICEERECTGCAACSCVCPKNAITMRMDDCGFWHPSIDDNLCITCGQCNRVCPVNKAPETKGPTQAYAYQNSDEVRFNSTSGGFFRALASKVIEEGGVVCGAAFDSNMVLRHTFVERLEDLEPLQRSKYVQSSLGGVYGRIRQYLTDGRKVLFAGVGCQAAALRNAIGENENLIIMDVVCYGVPSSGLFRDWIAYLELKYGKVSDVRFRDKSYGYASPNVKVMFENGKYIESCRDSNMYTDLFFRHLSIRESCYHCHFKTVDRASDITLGDLWSIGKYDKDRDDNKGTTVVFAHSEKGKVLCENICQMKLETEEVVSADARKMVECVSPARAVSGFWRKYCEDGYAAMTNLYMKNTAKCKAKYFVKKVMNGSGLSNYLYRIKKQKNLR